MSLHALVRLRIISRSGLEKWTESGHVLGRIVHQWKSTVVESRPVSLHALVQLRVISGSGLEKWSESGQVL